MTMELFTHADTMKKTSPFVYFWWLAGLSFYKLCCYLLLSLVLLSGTFVLVFLTKLFIWGSCRLRAREGQLQGHTMSSLGDAQACAHRLPMIYWPTQWLSFSPRYTKVNMPMGISSVAWAGGIFTLTVASFCALVSGVTIPAMVLS